jgi:hypothetical protein
MTSLDSVTTHRSKRTRAIARIVSARDDADPSGHRVLYVLGLGIAGAIVSNVLVFIYFASFYVQG